MSEIGLYIGPYSFELFSKDVSLHIKVPCALSSIEVQLKNTLLDLGAKIESVSSTRLQIHTNLSDYILKNKLNSSFAFLTTAGFEGLIQSPLLEKEFIFGIHERTTATGDLLKKINTEEILFLIEKLKALKINTLAIGLLHSQKYPQHEIELKKQFKEAGFRVHISSDYCHPSEYSDERIRFHNVIQEAAVDSSLFDKTEAVAKILIDYGFTRNNISIQKIKNLENKDLNTLFISADEACWVLGGHFIDVHPHPRTPVFINHWGALVWSENKNQNNPIALGRSTQLTVFDLLLRLDLEASFADTRINEKSIIRLQDSLQGLLKASSHSEQILNGFYSRLSREWFLSNPTTHPTNFSTLHFSGPYQNLLKKLWYLLDSKKLKPALCTNYNYFSDFLIGVDR